MKLQCLDWSFLCAGNLEKEELEQDFEEGDFEELCKEPYQNWLEAKEGE